VVGGRVETCPDMLAEVWAGDRATSGGILFGATAIHKAGQRYRRVAQKSMSALVQSARCTEYRAEAHGGDNRLPKVDVAGCGAEAGGRSVPG